MFKGTQGGAFAEHPRWKLYAQPGATKRNPETRWRGAQAGDPYGSRPGDPAGNRAEAVGHLGAAVFRQQLRLPTEEECTTGDTEGKGIRGAGIQIRCIGRPVQVFRYAEPRAAHESVAPKDTGYARTALNQEVSEKRSNGERRNLQNRRRLAAPQGGPLSPLLANIYLNEFDWEMKRRGVKQVRYADDIVVLAKSKRAAERLLESCRKYLEGRLKLQMNTEKSKVTSIFAQKRFKFLGFCLGKNGNGIHIRAHRKSLTKAKEKLRLLTKRNRGRNVRRVMQEVKVFIRGWIGYFRIAEMKRTLMAWDEWMRRRFRMYIWKQWKKPKTKVANLRKLGIPVDKAYQWGNSRLGYWRIAGSPVLKCSITNERLAAAGYFSILNYYESLHLYD